MSVNKAYLLGLSSLITLFFSPEDHKSFLSYYCTATRFETKPPFSPREEKKKAKLYSFVMPNVENLLCGFRVFTLLQQGQPRGAVLARSPSRALSLYTAPDLAR